MGRQDFAGRPDGAALFIDGDNVSAALAGQIQLRARRYGSLRISRVYRNATGCGWETSPGVEFHYTGEGDNAADFTIYLDAMEAALQRLAATVILVSSDGDLARLAMRLRAHGCDVIGIGEAKAPSCLREACNVFHQIGVEKPKPQPSAQPPSLLEIATDLIAAGGSAGVPIHSLGPVIYRETKKPMKDHGVTNWRSFLSKHPDRFALDPKGAKARVRLRT